MGKVVPTDAATHKAQNILEYQGRMSVTGMEKNSMARLHRRRQVFTSMNRTAINTVPKGQWCFIFEASNTEKVLRGFGHPER